MFDILYSSGLVITLLILLFGMYFMYKDGDDIKMNQIFLSIILAVLPFINLLIPLVLAYFIITTVLDFTVIKGKK